MFFFLNNDIDTRRICTKQPLFVVDSCIVKIRRDLGIGSGPKVFVDAGFKRLKVICCWEDGQGKRVPVSRSHGDKRVGECLCSVFGQYLFKTKFPILSWYTEMKSPVDWNRISQTRRLFLTVSWSLYDHAKWIEQKSFTKNREGGLQINKKSSFDLS